jgi:tetratricopeptide (TPR) repeat protein
VDEGIRMARRAIETGRDNSDVLWVAGYALGYLAGENDAALSAIDRAIILNPNCASAFGVRALMVAWLNRPDEAIHASRQAMRLSPLDPLTYTFSLALGLAHMAAGHYEAAVRWADHALRENGGTPSLRLKLSLCGHLGWIEEGRECLQHLREMHSEPTIAALQRDWPKALSPEFAARYVEGLRKAGMPEQ